MTMLRFALFATVFSLSAAAQSRLTPPKPLTDADRMQMTELTADEEEIPLPQPGDETLELVRNAPPVASGARIDLILVTTNRGDHPIREYRVRGGCGRRLIGVQIKDAGEKLLPEKETKTTKLPPPERGHIYIETCGGSAYAYFKVLQPGQKMWELMEVTPDDYDLSTPGTYTFQEFYGTDFEHATAKSNVLTLTILPKTDREP